MTEAASSLQEIASCIAGYDPKALPVARAQEFIALVAARERDFAAALFAARIARASAGSSMAAALAKLPSD